MISNTTVNNRWFLSSNLCRHVQMYKKRSNFFYEFLLYSECFSLFFTSYIKNSPLPYKMCIRIKNLTFRHFFVKKVIYIVHCTWPYAILDLSQTNIKSLGPWFYNSIFEWKISLETIHRNTNNDYVVSRPDTNSKKFKTKLRTAFKEYCYATYKKSFDLSVSSEWFVKMRN